MIPVEELETVNVSCNNDDDDDDDDANSHNFNSCKLLYVMNMHVGSFQ